MFIRAENGHLYNLDHFDAVEIFDRLANYDVALVDYHKDPNLQIFINDYDSKEKALKACDAIAETLDYSENVAFIDIDDDCEDENCQSQKARHMIDTHGINYISFDAKNETAIVYPKSGESYVIENVRNVVIV